MPIRVLCTTSTSPGAKANKPVSDPSKVRGLAIIADPKNPGLLPVPGDLPAPDGQFTKLEWVQFVGFQTEITDYSLLDGFPALVEIRFLRGNVALEDLPNQITSLVVEEAALQTPERSDRFRRFERIRISPLSAADAAAIGDHPGLRCLSVSQSLEPRIETAGWTRLTRLEHLFAASIDFTSLDFLRSMPALKDLQAMNLGMGSLGALSAGSLKRLIWTELASTQDYRGLERFTGLKELTLYQPIPSLDLLSGMAGMERLSIRTSHGSLATLATMTSLREAELSLPPGQDLTQLKGLPNLSKLMLSFSDGSPGIYLRTRKAVRERLDG